MLRRDSNPRRSDYETDLNPILPATENYTRVIGVFNALHQNRLAAKSPSDFELGTHGWVRTNCLTVIGHALIRMSFTSIENYLLRRLRKYAARFAARRSLRSFEIANNAA